MRSCMLLLVAALLLAGSAFAQQDDPVETTVWYFDSAANTWYQNPDDVEEQDARLFRRGGEWAGNCNKQQWCQLFSIRASVAAWIEFEVENTIWEWYIRKPGEYAGNGIDAWIKSNGDVTVTFSGFDHLQPQSTGATPIETRYTYTEYAESGWDPSDVPGWWLAPDLNDESVVLEEAANDFELHRGIRWRLWNKIKVVECNSMDEYVNEPTICLTLANQRDWIDFPTGNWGQVPNWPVGPR